MKNVVSWDVTPFRSCKNRRFRGTCRLHHQDDIIGELEGMLAVTSNWSTLKQLASVASYCYRCSQLSDSCRLHDGGNTFLRNVGSLTAIRRYIP
jgi:hypothetical protein